MVCILPFLAGICIRGEASSLDARPSVVKLHQLHLTFHLQTGFEFKKRRAFPVITGIVIAEENESALLEVRIPHACPDPATFWLTSFCAHLKAYWEAEQAAEAKRRAKREEQVLKRWTKLVQGLRIRQRLVEQYADRAPAEDSQAQSDAAAKQAAEEVRVFYVLYSVFCLRHYRLVSFVLSVWGISSSEYDNAM